MLNHTNDLDSRHCRPHRLPLVSTVAVLLCLTLAPTTATAAAKPTAKRDKAVVSIGHVVKVKVLANDRYGKKPKVKVVKTPAGVKAAVKGKTLRVKAKPNTSPGKKKVKYRLRDKSGRTDVGVVVVRIKHPTLKQRVKALKVAKERREGYDRNLYKHWNAGKNPNDGCDTRREVLVAEAVKKPKVGSGCSFTGGMWRSYYDGKTTNDASTFDMDHLVPLAENYDSGGYAWSAARREAYANDQGDPRTLVAVSASSNRSKGDRDPAEWMPPASAKKIHCRYVTEWVAVKTRWRLSIDKAEKKALLGVAKKCGPRRTKVVVR